MKKKLNKVTKLVIDRKKWARGQTVAGNKLRSESGMKCCLGFYGTALGLRSTSLTGKSLPEDVDSLLWPKWLVKRTEDGLKNTRACDLLVDANDSCDDKVTDEKREAKIANLFAKHGVEVEFK